MASMRAEETNGSLSRPAANDASAFTGAALNVFLADTAVLLAKTQACHWNAQGPGFFALHKLTEAQYADLFEAMDVLAERVRALDVPAPDGLAQMLELTTLEASLGHTEISAAIMVLAEDHAAMATHAQDAAEEMEQAGDSGSHDILVARVIAHQKAAWLLRSHVQHNMNPTPGDR